MRKPTASRLSENNPPTTTLRARAGGVIPLILGVIALSGAVLICLNNYWTWSRSAMPARVSKPMAELTGAQLEIALRRAGLTPERLASAGLDGLAVGAVVTSARVYLTEHGPVLAAADAGVSTAQAQADALRRRVESGLGNEGDPQSLVAAEAALASAKVARDAILLDLYTLSVSGLSNPQIAVLARLRANDAWDLPTPYMAVEREEAGWVGLRDDLTNLRVADQMGEEPDPACQQAVNAANADPAVSAAATNLSNNLAVVNQAWGEAIGG